MENNNKESLSNNMAMLKNILGCPFVFDGKDKADPVAFVRDFKMYVMLAGCPEQQQVMLFRLCLRGIAEQWGRSLSIDIGINEILVLFEKRFLPASPIMNGINLLSEMKYVDYADYLFLLDEMLVVGSNAKLPENVIVAFALRALPSGTATQITLLTGEAGLNWKILYDTCSRLNVESKTSGLESINAVKNSYSGVQRKAVKCYFCGKIGHIKRDCYLRKKQLKNNQVTNEILVEKVDDNQEKINHEFIYSVLSNQDVAKINVSLNGVSIKALIDTGSNLNLLDSKYVREIDLIYCGVKLYNANGQRIIVKGMRKGVKVKLQGNIFVGDFIVCCNLMSSCIIGVDFLMKNKMNINFSDGKIKLESLGYSQDSGLGFHRIFTGNSKPVASRMFRLGEKFDGIIEEQVQLWLKEGVIREARDGEWRSSPLVVKKDNGKAWRVPIDYRELNKVTKEDKYPMPHTEDLFDYLQDARFFTKLDAKSGFLQIDMHPDDIEKTAFATKSGIYEFLKMPFGLVNAAATFQRSMDRILKKEKGKYVIIYIDDILIYSKTMLEHKDHVKVVMGKLKDAGLELNEKKCVFCAEKIKFLGHIISGGTIMPDPERVKAIRELKMPSTKRQIQSYLGLINYCRKFIKNLAMKAAPFYELLKGTVTNSQIKDRVEKKEVICAFEEVKESIAKNVDLWLPDTKKEFILTTDASNIGIGGVLSQIIGNKERVVSYFSVSLSSAQKNYAITEKELLAIVEG